jgi:hypothetical protein
MLKSNSLLNKTMLFCWVVMPCELIADTSISDKYTVSIISPEDGDSMFFQNTGIWVYTVPQTRIIALNLSILNSKHIFDFRSYEYLTVLI